LTRAAPRSLRLEFGLAAAVLAVPVWYFATEITPDPWILGWSKRWVAALLTCLVLGALVLASYRVALPRPLAVARRLAVLLSISTFACLLGLELALNAVDSGSYEPLDNSGRHVADPDLGHVYAPNHRQVLQSREFRALWTSNAQGVRAPRDFGPKPIGAVRVLCVGDSFTACDQVDYEGTWSAHLEAQLNLELGAGRVEVVNAGFPGFNTVNEARWIAKFGAAFEPDLVLLAMTPNDLSENQFPLQYTARDGALVSSRSTRADGERHAERASWWRLAAAVERSLLLQRIERSPRARKLLGRPEYNHVEAYLVAPNEKSRKLFALAGEHVLAARDNAAKLGARFALLTIPYRHQLRELGPGLDGARFGAQWVEFGAEHGFPAADALPEFLAAERPESLHWKEDTHCTAAGNAAVAAAARKLLLEHRDALGLEGESR
jgi:lysophospholipase L1-like esterase